MAYDDDLAARLRASLAGTPGLTERKMFGGLALLVNGNMVCGIVREDLMVRVGPALWEESLKQPHTRTMDFTGKPMRGMLYVNRDGWEDPRILKEWLGKALSFAAGLPPK